MVLIGKSGGNESQKFASHVCSLYHGNFSSILCLILMYGASCHCKSTPLSDGKIGTDVLIWTLDLKVLLLTPKCECDCIIGKKQHYINGSLTCLFLFQCPIFYQLVYSPLTPDPTEQLFNNIFVLRCLWYIKNQWRGQIESQTQCHFITTIHFYLTGKVLYLATLVSYSYRFPLPVFRFFYWYFSTF